MNSNPWLDLTALEEADDTGETEVLLEIVPEHPLDEDLYLGEESQWKGRLRKHLPFGSKTGE